MHNQLQCTGALIQPVCLADVVTDVLSYASFSSQTFKFGDNDEDLLGWKVSLVLNSPVCPNEKLSSRVILIFLDLFDAPGNGIICHPD